MHWYIYINGRLYVAVKLLLVVALTCRQSTILLLYHCETVTFALPCVHQVGPIYSPITCNVLRSQDTVRCIACNSSWNAILLVLHVLKVSLVKW